MSNSKRLGLIVTALCVAMLCGQAIAAEFTADLLLNDPSDSATAKLYVRGDLYRIENLEGQHRFMAIENLTTGVTTAFDPEQMTYVELEGMAGAFANPLKGWVMMARDKDEKLIGTETVGGYECEHYTYSYPGETTPLMEIWKSPKLGFFVKQVMHIEGSDDVSMEVVNVAEGPVDDVLFGIPEGYTREKTAEEIEMERPAITSKATAEAPVGRRLAAGGVLSVKVDPKLSVDVQLNSLTGDSAVCLVHLYRNGEKIDFSGTTPPEVEEFTLTYKGDRRQEMYGMQNEADEIRISVLQGRVMATVTHRYSSFDDVQRQEYYVAAPGRGVSAPEGKALSITLTGDSQAADVSKVTLRVYGRTWLDGSEQQAPIEDLEFDLKNGEVKELSYPAGEGAVVIDIKVDKAGGVKVLTEQL